MAYSESDLQIINVDVIEDKPKRKKRGLLLLLFFALFAPALVISLLLNLLAGPTKVSAESKTSKAPFARNAGTKELTHNDSPKGSRASVGEPKRTVDGAAITKKGTNDRRVSSKVPSGRMAYARVADTRGSNGNRRQTSLAGRKAKLKRDIGNLYPDLYKDVDTRIVNGSEIGVDIRMDSTVLDGLSQNEILQSLDQMESLLRTKYTGLVPSVTLSDGKTKFKLSTSNLVGDYISQSIKSQFLDLNPRIYNSVEVEIEVKKATRRSGREVWKRVKVKKVEIHVNSRAWDAEPGTDKVDLLHKTAQFLEGLYPDVTRFVTLKFDDWREDLRLKSGAVHAANAL